MFVSYCQLWSKFGGEWKIIAIFESIIKFIPNNYETSYHINFNGHGNPYRRGHSRCQDHQKRNQKADHPRLLHNGTVLNQFYSQFKSLGKNNKDIREM